MLTVWRYVEIGRFVAVELTRTWHSWDVVELFTITIFMAHHATTHSFWSSWKSRRQSSTQCRWIQRAQSCSIRRTCHQFHCFTVNFSSRQNQHHQQRQNVHWRHCFVSLWPRASERLLYNWTTYWRHQKLVTRKFWRLAYDTIATGQQFQLLERMS